MDGIIVVNKPSGMTSRMVVDKVSKCIGTKKIGHTGTLDPMATGVLVLCVGKGLKLCELLTNHTKDYVAGITLGIETDTFDTDGIILNECDVLLDDDKIFDAVNSFNGTYLQEVPKYSAVKVNGKKLYEYARNNQDVVLPKKNVEISNLKIISKIERKDNHISFFFSCSVSKGTYIRALIRDIGLKLGYPAVMFSLNRTRLGDFTLDDCNELDNILNGNIKMITINDALKNMKHLIVDDNMAVKIKNGVVFDKLFDSDMAAIYDNYGNLLAIYKNDINNKSRVYKMF